MSGKAICTNNREHKNFIATAIVYQDWVVDESGNFIEVQNECSQVYIKPNMDQEWTCSDCGAVAKTVDVAELNVIIEQHNRLHDIANLPRRRSKTDHD